MAALEAVSALRPAVVLDDVQLPGLDGIAVAERVAARPDPPAVVLISSRRAAAYGPRLTRAPACGSSRRASSRARRSPSCSSERPRRQLKNVRRATFTLKTAVTPKGAKAVTFTHTIRLR